MPAKPPALALLTLLCACSPAPVDTDAAIDTWTDTGTPPAPEYREIAPQWTAEEAVAYLEEVFAYGWLDPVYTWGEFNGLLAFGDEECPGNNLQSISSLWGCWSDSGYWYLGPGSFTWQESEGTDAEGAYLLEELRTREGDFEILTPSGERFVSGASYEWSRLTYPRRTLASTVFRGSMQWTGSDRAWLANSMSAALWTTAQIGGGTSVRIMGAYGVDGHYVYFEDLFFDGDSCGWQPKGGAVHLRQADQSSTVLTFDDDCSGCVDVTWEDQDLGRVCADWSAYALDIANTTTGAP
ncbi:MAG: hypothetical protein V4850_25765 [Myxococcota bacterium]